MPSPRTTEVRDTGHVAVHFWAAARAAAGRAGTEVPVDGPTSLAEVTGAVLAQHGGDPRLQRVLGVCSVLVDDRPAGAGDPAEVVVHPGQAVQYLPPFAGG